VILLAIAGDVMNSYPFGRIYLYCRCGLNNSTVSTGLYIIANIQLLVLEGWLYIDLFQLRFIHLEDDRVKRVKQSHYRP
jgi:hypothetical protein